MPAQNRYEPIESHLRALDMAQAFEAARKALAAARTPEDLAGARYWLARCHYGTSDFDVAMVLAAEASAAATQAASPLWLARVQALQANCLDFAGEPQAALDLALLALHEVEPLDTGDDDVRVARQEAVTAMGYVHLSLGDVTHAMEWTLRSVEIARTLPHQGALAAAKISVALVHGEMATRARAADDAIEAERCVRMAIACGSEAADVARRAGCVDLETNALLNMAEWLTMVGESAQALELLNDWERHHPDALPRQRWHQRASLGQVYLSLGRPQDAVIVLEESLAAVESDLDRVVNTEQLSMALERCGRWEEALAHYKAYHALHLRVSAERAQRNARVAAARIDIGQERARSRTLASSNTELRRRAQDLARQASEDALTGLANRRAMGSLFEQRSGSMSVVLVDVDHFKRVNDTHSHAVGDLVLKQLASIMRDNCRPHDLPARLGGEEFVVLLDATSQAEVASAAERLREAVEGFDWPSIAHALRVTISIGFATPSEARSSEDLLALADKRLYIAKNQGRNRVIGPH